MAIAAPSKVSNTLPCMVAGTLFAYPTVVLANASGVMNMNHLTGSVATFLCKDGGAY